MRRSTTPRPPESCRLWVSINKHCYHNYFIGVNMYLFANAYQSCSQFILWRSLPELVELVGQCTIFEYRKYYFLQYKLPMVPQQLNIVLGVKRAVGILRFGIWPHMLSQGARLPSLSLLGPPREFRWIQIIQDWITVLVLVLGHPRLEHTIVCDDTFNCAVVKVFKQFGRLHCLVSLKSIAAVVSFFYDCRCVGLPFNVLSNKDPQQEAFSTSLPQMLRGRDVGSCLLKTIVISLFS